jgi:hypothetical protein
VRDFRLLQLTAVCEELRYNAASIGNFLPTFRDNLPILGTDRLSRNVGDKSPLLAAIAQNSAVLRTQLFFAAG